MSEIKYKKAIVQPEQMDFKQCEGLFVKTTILSRGHLVAQHSHTYEHISFIATGSVRVWESDKDIGTFNAPTGIVIKANTKHRFLSLENNTTVLCIHRTDETGDIPIEEENRLEFE